MQVFITGGTGFIGGYLRRHFLDQGHGVTIVGSRSASAGAIHPRCRYLQADTTQPGEWQQVAGCADLIVNLAGRTISQRWTAHYKQAIYDSRIQTTRHIVAALPAASRAVLVSTSAVGYYGDGGETVLTEYGPNGHDFLADLARDWEAEALRAESKGVRVAIARFGIVLGADGGALATMLPAFHMGVGGPLGNGRQWFPWIHLDDLMNAILFLSTRADLNGAFNVCSPQPARNKDFVHALGRALGRPAFMPAPAFALRLLLGEMASMLLAGQRAVPAKLLAAGFEFRYPLLEDALAQLLNKSK